MEDSTVSPDQLTLPFEPLEQAINEALRWRRRGMLRMDLVHLLGTDAIHRAYYRARAAGRINLNVAEQICEQLTWHPRMLWPDDWDRVVDLAASTTVRKGRGLSRSREPVALPPGAEHGTIWAYDHYRCSCDLCRAVKAEAQRAAKAKRAARRQGIDPVPGPEVRREGSSVVLPPNTRHGSVYAYRHHGCRCEQCTSAEHDAKRLVRRRAQGSAA